MPIYEYRCANCQRELETMQKISDAPLKTCPSCGKDSLNKLISRSSFQLKGSGWYNTGYSKETDPKTPKTNPAADNKPAATETAKTTTTATTTTTDKKSSSSTSSSSGEK